jgi:hypothetical protein
VVEDKFTHDNLRDLIFKMLECVDDGETSGTLTRYDIARVLPKVDALVIELCRDKKGAY